MSKKVSVVIKALNEEAKIATAIESALAAVAPLGGEVILADSLSTDKTIEIGQRYPIKITQLIRPEDRSCGIGAQLGYQYSEGEFIYVLDGDMRMHPGFLEQAVARMEADTDIAGVGGRVVERNLESLEFQARQNRAPANMQPGEVDRLDMGGLYRRSAVEKVGYLTNRNLHSYEEFDLGIRLRSAGFRLIRIPVDAVDHFGHTTEAFSLLKKRWRSRYIFGSGEVLKAGFGQRHFGLLLRDLRELRLYAVVHAWILATLALLVGALAGAAHPLAPLGLLITPFAGYLLKKRNIQASMYALSSLLMHAIALLVGLLQPQIRPDGPIQFKKIK